MVGRARTLSLSINWGSSSLARTPSARSTVTVESIGPPGVLRKHSQTRPKDAHGQPNNTMDVEKPKEHPRRLSRRSPSTGASRWRLPSRKNSKQPEHEGHDEKDGDMKNKKDADADSVKDSDDGRPMSMLEKQEQRQQLQNLGAFGASNGDLSRGGSTSVVPDPLPTYTEQLLQQIPGVLPPIRTNYTVNNPRGPKTYLNHHLIEPHTRMPISSTFSPSFPPMRTTVNGGAIVMDSLRIPGPSRSRTNSPIATPNASQTRLGEGLTQGAPGTRSRKVSQTAHDNVDMLDASDPWGQNWHHHSPYDVGLTNVPTQSPAQDPQIRTTGSRTSSTTKLNARPTNPSPLSKSTSAVNLAEPSAVALPPRTASTKGGTAGAIRRLMSGTSDEQGGGDPTNHVKAHSAPVTPLADRERSSPDKLEVPVENAHVMRRKLSKRGRMATAPPSVPAAGSSTDSHEREARMLRPPLNGSAEKSHRRSSVLDKISKKISLLRNKPIGDSSKRNSSASPTKEQSRPESALYSDPRRLSKRVPPPSAQAHEVPGNRRSASIDIEMPLTMGPLTIANPDTPSSGTASPINIRSSLLQSQSSGQPEHMEGESLRQQSESPILPPKRSSPPLQVSNPNSYQEHESSSGDSSQQPTPEVEGDVRSHQLLRPNGAPLLPSLHLSPGRISLALSATSSHPPPLPEKDGEWAFVNPTTLTDSPVEENPPANSIPEPQPERRTPSPQPLLEVPPATVQRTASQQSLSLLAPPQARLAALSTSGDTAFSRLSTIVNPPTPHVHPSPIPSNSSALVESLPTENVSLPAHEHHHHPHSSEKPNLVATSSSRPAAMRNSFVDVTSPNVTTSEVAGKRESRREERSRHEERRERSSRQGEKQRYEERQSRVDEGVSPLEEKHNRHEERTRSEEKSRREERPRRDSAEKEKERLSKYEDKSRHEERARRDSAEKEKARQERSRQEDVVAPNQTKVEEKQRQDSADRENPPRREKKRSTTEKFQLVRTPSDNIRMVSDTIPVGEEQWTLVETTTSNSRREKRERTRDDRERERERDRTKDGGERDRDRDHGRERDRASPEKGSSRRDSRREDKYASVRSDPTHGHSSSTRQREDRQRSTITRASKLLDQPIRPQRLPSTERNLGGSTFPTQTGSRISPQTPEKDRPSERRSRREERPYASDPRSSYVNDGNDSKLYQAGPPNAGRRSSNRRPTSEVPATAETINNITASEHWQADRLWKGQSAVIDHENRPYIPSTYDPRYSTFSVNSTVGTHPAVDSMYGSNHTSYLMQSPFAGNAPHPNSFYAIPVAPPPTMVYPTVVQGSPEAYGYFHPYAAYSESVPPFPVQDPQSPQNPLPEPPRQSVYSPEPLRRGRPGSLDDPSTPEYWSLYAGIPSH